jgi:hypothetical protein
MVGSITEDTYFAMYLAALGVRFDWCGGKMYEQSPFTCLDFAKQRARWFSGLWLCVCTKTLPLWQRVFLGTHLVSWSMCPLLTLVTWLNLLVLFPRTQAFIYLMSFVFAIPFFSYALGFVLGSSPKQLTHGLVEWTLLLILHLSLIPIYTVMETWGVARGILDRSTYTGFHIVQKEKTPSPAAAGGDVTGAGAAAGGALPAPPPAPALASEAPRAPAASAEALKHLPPYAVAIGSDSPHLPGGGRGAPYVAWSGAESGFVPGSEENLEYWKRVMNIDYDELELRSSSAPPLQDAAARGATTAAATAATRIASVAELAAFAQRVNTHLGSARHGGADGGGGGVPVDVEAVVVALVGSVLQRYVRSGEVLLGLVTKQHSQVAEDSEPLLRTMPVAVVAKAGQTFAELAAEVAQACVAGAARTRGVSIDALRSAVVARPALFHLVVRMEDEARAVSGIESARVPLRSDIASAELSVQLQVGAVCVCVCRNIQSMYIYII